MRPVRRIPIGGCTVRVILITHAFRFRTFPDRLVGLPALLGIINDLPVILQLLRNACLRNQDVQIVWGSRQRLVAILERLGQVSGTLVGLGNLPISISDRRGIGRKLLQKILVHCEFLLRVRLFGDVLQSLIFRRASRDHDSIQLRIRK